jgi:putative glutamine transport system substrate-binding protein
VAAVNADCHRVSGALVALAAIPLAALLAGLAPAPGVAQPRPASTAAPAPAPLLAGDTWAQVQKAGRGTVTVAYYYPLEGFAYLDSSGKLTGLIIDIAEQFRSYLKNVRGVDLTFRNVAYDDFPRLYADVRQGSGGVFGLAGTTINEPRKKEVSFGPPFFSSMPVLVTNPEVPDVTSRERIPVELAGFTALAFRGTTLEALTRRLKAERFPSLGIEVMPHFRDITARLSRDTRAFAYLDLNVFWSERKRGARIKRHRVGDQPREEFGFIMPLGSDWQAPLADFFATGGGYRNSRSYRQLMIKHLGVDLQELLDTRGGKK